MRAIDKLFTKHPFFGSRQISSWLAREGIKVGRHRVRRLMRQMGLQAVYRRPKTSQPHPTRHTERKPNSEERPDQQTEYALAGPKLSRKTGPAQVTYCLAFCYALRQYPIWLCEQFLSALKSTA
jgi:hypothetical protein